MFYLKYFFKNCLLAIQLVLRGEWRRVFEVLHARLYLRWHGLLFPWRARGERRRAPAPAPCRLEVVTDHPVALGSPDHLAPHGTRYNNSTNGKFVLLMNQLFRRRFPDTELAFMDLGCSGGQLVRDFKEVHWIAVGLEGSDYSLKSRRANWATLAGTNLFTCDITKPFQVRRDGQPLKCNLITAWEVLEHLKIEDLDQLFRNLACHLVEGGCFIASTSSAPSVVDGLELHQTRMTNAEWRRFVADRHPGFQWDDLGLKIYQHVRFDFGERSHLVYRWTGRAPAPPQT